MIKIRKGVLMASLITMLATLMGGCNILKNKMVVGKDIQSEDITEFVYTDSTTANPPELQRYCFYKEDGEYYFKHEWRSVSNFFDTKLDPLESGTLYIAQEEWDKFFNIIEGGVVTKIKENTDTGHIVTLFLYWNGDKDTYQEFSFASSDKRLAFEELCNELKLRDQWESLMNQGRNDPNELDY